MDSESPAPPVVKPDNEENAPAPPVVFPAQIPVIECERLCRRMDLYLQGWFTNGVPCVMAAEMKRRFKKCTGYSWKHIDDVFPAFQRWSTNFLFKKQRFGRSTCIVITVRYRPMILSKAEVRRRLVGAIVSHVGKSGRAHVDRKFLENFHRLTGLPPEHIFYAWRTLHRIEGLACRWRGRGGGINFYVQAPRANVGRISHPENASGISPPTGGKELKTSADKPHGSPDKHRSSLRSPRGEVRDDPARGDAPPDPLDGAGDQSNRPGSPPGGDSSRPSGQSPPGQFRSNSWENSRAGYRWRAMAEPLHVCDRWISAARLGRKANFLAFMPMQAMHAEFFRVRFRAAHARNFAAAALTAGFLDSEICAAWRVGLAETHASATRDWHAAGIIGEWEPREPSQAVARAWLRLRSDERTDEQRWAAIFRGERTPQRVFAPAPPAVTDPASRAPASPRRRDFAQITPGLRVRNLDAAPDDFEKKKRAAAKRPDPARGLLRASLREPATFEKYLAHRKMSLGDLLAQPRAAQQAFVRALHAWQKAGAPASPVNPFVKD